MEPQPDVFAQIATVQSIEMLDAIVSACRRQKAQLDAAAATAAASSHIGDAFAHGGNLFRTLPPSFADVAAAAAKLPPPKEKRAKKDKRNALYIPCMITGCDCPGYRRHIEQECETCGFYSVGELPFERCPQAPKAPSGAQAPDGTDGPTSHVLRVLNDDPRMWNDVDWTGLFMLGLPTNGKILPQKPGGLHARLRRIAINATSNAKGIRVHVIPDREREEYPYGTAIIKTHSHPKAAAIAKALRAHFAESGDAPGFVCNYRQRNSKQHQRSDSE